MLSLVPKGRAGIIILKINKQGTEKAWSLKKAWSVRKGQSGRTFWQIFDHIVLFCLSLEIYF